MNQTASVGVWHYLGISALVLCPFFIHSSCCADNRSKETIHSSWKEMWRSYLFRGGRNYSKHLSFCLLSFGIAMAVQVFRVAGLPQKGLELNPKRERERRILAFIYHNLYVEPHARPLTNIILFNFLNNPIQQPHNTWRSRNVEWRKEIKKHKGEGIWVYVVRKEEGRLSDTSLMQY